jgi:mannose-1-phosphate guanylyltransferase
MQALILVGGEGTRLRPLTSTMPKPVVPLAGQPFITYMLEWLGDHGVDDVILACGFLPDGIKAVLGDGSGLGLRLRYVVEPEPLGTAGALKYAEDLLDDRFFMLNGDVLTDMDLTAQLGQHERTGAIATLALMAVEDPSAYGLVRRDPECAVTGFLEKPKPEQIDTNLVNAGAYFLHREVLDYVAPAGTNCSIERDVFPALVGKGLYGYEASGYWLDIGTPARYLDGVRDILGGAVDTHVGHALAATGGRLVDGATIEGSVHAPALLGSGTVVAAGAVVAPGTSIGARVQIGAGARVARSAVLDDVVIGERTAIEDSIIGPGVTIGDDCRVEDGVVLGRGVRVGSRNVLSRGARIFPGVELPDGGISF